MSIRTISVILLAILCGLCAVGGVSLMLAKPGVVQPVVQTVPVLIAKLEIPRGKLLAKEAVEVKEWPKELVPAGIMSNPVDAESRAALQTIQPGEPIFEVKLAARGAIGGMANLIPAGKRAYTVQTRTVASNVAGFVLPGNLVDVLLTFRGNVTDETGGGSTTTLLQAVEVMAVGNRTEQVASTLGTVANEIGIADVSSVTLLVTPEEVTRLELGQSLGILALTLRNPNDQAEVKTDPATMSRFLGMKPVTPPSTLNNSVAFSPSPRPQEPESVKPAAPEEKLVSTSILTLRGQSWGEVRVTGPRADVPVANSKP